MEHHATSYHTGVLMFRDAHSYLVRATIKGGIYRASCSTRRDMTLNLPTDPNFFEQLFNVLDPVRIPKNAPRKNHEYSRVRYLNWLNIFERKCLKLFLFLTSFVGNLKLLSNAWLIFSIQRLLQQIFGKNRSL